MLAKRIDAGVRQHQSIDRLTPDDVGLDNLVDIGGCHAPVPNPVRIDNQIGTVFTLIEASRFVCPYSVFETALCQFLLEGPLQFGLAGGITTSAGTVRGTLVAADKEVAFELGH